MNQKKSSLLLNITLIICAIFALVYGLLYLFIPQVLVGISEGGPVHSGWLRWSGAILVALGIGAVMVLRKPANQGILVTIYATGTLLCGLALLFSALFESPNTGNLWFTLIPAVINLIISLLFWISLKKDKLLLCGNVEV